MSRDDYLKRARILGRDPDLGRWMARWTPDSQSIWSQMRDPNRIPRVVLVLTAAWRRNPEQRMGQLIINAMAMFREEAGDLYQLDDDDMIKALEAYGQPSKKAAAPRSQKAKETRMAPKGERKVRKRPGSAQAQRKANYHRFHEH
jgi:hypothetical protein